MAIEAWKLGCLAVALGSCLLLSADRVGATWPLYPQAEAQSKPLKGGQQGHELGPSDSTDCLRHALQWYYGSWLPQVRRAGVQGGTNAAIWLVGVADGGSAVDRNGKVQVRAPNAGEFRSMDQHAGLNDAEVMVKMPRRARITYGNQIRCDGLGGLEQWRVDPSHQQQRDDGPALSGLIRSAEYVCQMSYR